MTEKMICSVCNELSLSDCIYCELCNTWLHAKCLKLNKIMLKKLSLEKEPWFCIFCVARELPFTNSAQNVFNSIQTNNSLNEYKEKKESCNICNKISFRLPKSCFGFSFKQTIQQT